MKATVFFSSTARILFSSIMFLAGCGGLSNTISAPGAAGSAQGTFAFVYVLSNPSGSNFAINAFSANSNGQLTPVPGSPFAANVQTIAANRNYLFGTDGENIYSFSIGSNGALTRISSINAVQFTPGSLGFLFLDRTGSTLYDKDFFFDGANTGDQSFSIDGSTGALTSVGGIPVEWGSSLSFVGSNLYGYTSNNFHFSCMIDALKRNNDGALTFYFRSFLDNPPGAPAGSGYCPGAIAADQANHLAIAFSDATGPGAPPPSLNGKVALAVYTADSAGDLTSTSTFADMPQTAAGDVLAISPSGKFLAAGGRSGLEVFHFNGADPITPFTGLLMNDPVDQISWDNDNNLYAISRSTSKLSVFTVTATSVTQAAGSPYTITNPMAVVVVPRK